MTGSELFFKVRHCIYRVLVVSGKNYKYPDLRTGICGDHMFTNVAYFIDTVRVWIGNSNSLLAQLV